MGRKKTQGDHEPEVPLVARVEGRGHETEGDESPPVGSVTGPRPVPHDNGPHGNKNGGARVPPVHTVQCGRVRGVVWRNLGPEGEWFSVSITRSYKDHSNPPVWKQAATFARDDLLVLGEVSRALWAWIVQRQAGGTETSKPAQTSDEPIPF